MKIPINPLVSTASLIPLNSVLPNPNNGTDAPAPANSTKGGYTPIAPKTAPEHTNSTIIRPGCIFVFSIKIWQRAHISPPTPECIHIIHVFFSFLPSFLSKLLLLFIIYQAFVTAHTQALLHGQFPVHFSLRYNLLWKAMLRLAQITPFSIPLK